MGRSLCIKTVYSGKVQVYILKAILLFPCIALYLWLLEIVLLYALIRPRVPTTTLTLCMVLDRATLLEILFQILRADGKKESL